MRKTRRRSRQKSFLKEIFCNIEEAIEERNRKSYGVWASGLSVLILCVDDSQNYYLVSIIK